jgi:hypothetical protein
MNCLHFSTIIKNVEHNEKSNFFIIMSMFCFDICFCVQVRICTITLVSIIQFPSKVLPYIDNVLQLLEISPSFYSVGGKGNHDKQFSILLYY